jgi:hypothetical protein
MIYSMHHHHHHHHNKYPHIYFLSPDIESEHGAFNTHISTSSARIPKQNMGPSAKNI